MIGDSGRRGNSGLKIQRYLLRLLVVAHILVKK